MKVLPIVYHRQVFPYIWPHKDGNLTSPAGISGVKVHVQEALPGTDLQVTHLDINWPLRAHRIIFSLMVQKTVRNCRRKTGDGET